MKSILVPTDFSKNANNAIEYACELAKSLDASILILHVYTPALTKHNVAVSVIEQEIAEAKKVAEQKLNAVCQDIQQQTASISCTSEFAVGGIVDAVEAITNSGKADLVVMGTKGASGLDRILFGSNATRVIEKVSCPVLAIPMGQPFRIPKRIIYATDFHDAELNHINKVASIANAFKAELMIAHITTDTEATLSEEMLKRNFAARVKNITDYSPISYFVKYEDHISRALESLVQQIDADWIALMTRNRTMFEKLYNPSLTKELAYQTKIPLLAIKN